MKSGQVKKVAITKATWAQEKKKTIVTPGEMLNFRATSIDERVRHDVEIHNAQRDPTPACRYHTQKNKVPERADTAEAIVEVLFSSHEIRRRSAASIPMSSDSVVGIVCFPFCFGNPFACVLQVAPRRHCQNTPESPSVNLACVPGSVERRQTLTARTSA